MKKRSILYSHHYPPRGRWWLEDIVFAFHVVLLFKLLLYYANDLLNAHVTTMSLMRRKGE